MCEDLLLIWREKVKKKSQKLRVPILRYFASKFLGNNNNNNNN